MTKLPPRAQYLEDNLRAKAWHDFLRHIGWYTNRLLVPLANNIWNTIPPTYIRSDDDSWEYLRQIAHGFVLIHGCGLVCRSKLAQFLRENAPCLSSGRQVKVAGQGVAGSGDEAGGEACPHQG